MLIFLITPAFGKNKQNEHSTRQNQSSTDQHFESTPILQSIAPPTLQLKANGISGEGESEQEKGAYQFIEKEITSGAEDKPFRCFLLLHPFN